MTPLYFELYEPAQARGWAETAAECGLAVRSVEYRLGPDGLRFRPVPLIGRPGAPPPPDPAVWLASRLHPRFRARLAAARTAIDGRCWERVCDRWALERASVIDRIGRVAASLDDWERTRGDDVELAEILEAVTALVAEGIERHFAMAGPLMIGIGLFLEAAGANGTSDRAAVTAVARTPPQFEPGSIPPRFEASWQLDRPLFRCDVDSPTIRDRAPDPAHPVEGGPRSTGATHLDPRPALAAGGPRPGQSETWGGPVDLPTARRCEDVRNDNAAVLLDWPVGLLRRALRHAARRLDPDPDGPWTVDDLAGHPASAIIEGLRRQGGPATGDRSGVAAIGQGCLPVSPDAGSTDVEMVPPPFDRMPDPLRAANRAFFHALASALGDDGADDGGAGRPPPDPHQGLDPVVLRGTGVGGSTPGCGRAVVVTGGAAATEALDRIEHGDVLVTGTTTPSFDALLPMLAALVVEEGGLMSHAAITARAHGLPAVVGVADACARVRDGQRLCVDPVAGTVTADERPQPSSSRR